MNTDLGPALKVLTSAICTVLAGRQAYAFLAAWCSLGITVLAGCMQVVSEDVHTCAWSSLTASSNNNNCFL